MRSEIVLAMALAALLQGCGPRTTLESSSVDQFAADAAELDFWQQLEQQRVLTNNDALHGLLLLADNADAAGGYEQRVEAARQRGWLRSSASPPANESATIGMVAVAVCEMLDVKGGLSMRLTGLTPRYCTRELIAMRILPSRSENQSLSGLEFLDLASRVDGQRSSDAGLIDPALPPQGAGEAPAAAPTLDAAGK